MKYLCLLLLAALTQPASGQLSVEFESAQNLQLAFAESLPDDRHDANGDGITDFVFIQRSQGGGGIYNDGRIVIACATCEEPIAEIPAADVFAALGVVEFQDGDDLFLFRGFVSLDGGETRSAVFRGPESLAIIGVYIGKKNSAISIPARRVIVQDIDDDGENELIVGNPVTNTVQVYGRGSTGTATRGLLERRLQALSQNFPNPFSSETTIAYEVEQPGYVELEIFDMLGRRVRTLVEGDHAAGAHSAQWDGTDASGRPVAAGSYIYRLRIDGVPIVRQASIIR